MDTTLPWHDPIVAEIHATRERLAEQYHNDLVAYSQAEAHCRALGFRMAESPGVEPSTVGWDERSDSQQMARRMLGFVPQPSLP